MRCLAAVESEGAEAAGKEGAFCSEEEYRALLEGASRKLLYSGGLSVCEEVP
jgi:hypothetical protein